MKLTLNLRGYAPGIVYSQVYLDKDLEFEISQEKMIEMIKRGGFLTFYTIDGAVTINTSAISIYWNGSLYLNV